MRRFLFLLPRLCTVSLAVLALGCGHAALDVKIPREEVVTLISKQFPITRTAASLTVTLSQPRVRFDGEHNRIEISSDLDVAMTGIPAGPGRVTIDAALATGDGGVLLQDVEVRDVTLDASVGENADVMKKFVSQSLVQSLEGLKIYSFGADTLASRSVAGIAVTEDGLQVHLEMAP